jgi:hypothetical protein
MNSYISSFKAVLAALAVIAAIEAGYEATAPAAPVERSGYLNLNFNVRRVRPQEPDPGEADQRRPTPARRHPDRRQLWACTASFRASSTNISAAAVRDPELLRQHRVRGLLRHHQFMLRHVPSIKAVVLYTSLNNAARDPANLDAIIVGGPERLSNAFGALSPLTTPPTLAARAAIVRSVTRWAGRSTSRTCSRSPRHGRSSQFLRDTRGWRPEGDVHRTAEKHAQAFGALCGPTGERRLEGPRAEDRARNIAGGVARSCIRDRAQAARRAHGAAQGEADHGVPALSLRSRGRALLAALKSDIAAVTRDHPYLVGGPGAVRAWSAQRFASADHAETGYEDAASRRAGRLIARALGLSPVEPNPPPAAKAAGPIWSSSDFGSPWRAEGYRLLGNRMAPSWRRKRRPPACTMSKDAARPPAGRYVASLTSAATRSAWSSYNSCRCCIRGAGTSIAVRPTARVTRSMSVLDADLRSRPATSSASPGQFILSRPGRGSHG